MPPSRSTAAWAAAAGETAGERRHAAARSTLQRSRRKHTPTQPRLQFLVMSGTCLTDCVVFTLQAADEAPLSATAAWRSRAGSGWWWVDPRPQPLDAVRADPAAVSALVLPMNDVLSESTELRTFASHTVRWANILWFTCWSTHACCVAWALYSRTSTS